MELWHWDEIPSDVVDLDDYMNDMETPERKELLVQRAFVALLRSSS